MLDAGRVTTRAEDAQGTPTQSHISTSILEYEDKPLGRWRDHQLEQIVRLKLANRDVLLVLRTAGPDLALAAAGQCLEYIYIYIYIYWAVHLWRDPQPEPLNVSRSCG